LRVEPDTHLRVTRFQVRGQARPAAIVYGGGEALLGAAEAAGDWEERRGPLFRYGSGFVSRLPEARVKWNVVGRALALYAPRGPEFGTVEVRLDGRVAAVLDLRADLPEASQVIWRSADGEDGGHALVLVSKSGRMPVDALEVWSGSGTRTGPISR
jgi:hypothetical protein